MISYNRGSGEEEGTLAQVPDNVSPGLHSQDNDFGQVIEPSWAYIPSP